MLYALLFIALLGSIYYGRYIRGKYKAAERMSHKHLQLFQLAIQWIKIKQCNKDIAKFLLEHGYKKVAIYGMSYLGERLLEELEGSGVIVSFVIDTRAKDLFFPVDVLLPTDKFEDVDAIIVTSVTYFDDIEEMLSLKVSCPIVAFDDVLYDV